MAPGRWPLLALCVLLLCGSARGSDIIVVTGPNLTPSLPTTSTTTSSTAQATGTPVPSVTFTTLRAPTSQATIGTSATVKTGLGGTTITTTTTTLGKPTALITTTAPPLSCPQNTVLPEDPVFPWRTFSFMVRATSSVGLRCASLLLSDSTSSTQEVLFSDVFSSQTTGCTTTSLSLGSITAKYNMSLGTPMTSMQQTTADSTKRTVTLNVPWDADSLLFKYIALNSLGAAFQCIFSVRVNTSSTTASLQAVLKEIDTVSSSNAQMSSMLSSLLNSVIQTVSVARTLTPLQYSLAVTALQRSNALILAAPASVSASFEFNLFCILVDRLFARITPGNVQAAAAAANGDQTSALRAALESASGRLPGRFSGGGISAETIPMSRARQPVSVVFNTSSQWVSFTSSAPGAPLFWYAAVDNRLTPLLQDTMNVVSPVAALRLNSSSLLNVSVLFRPAFFFPDLRCAVLPSGSANWVLTNPPVPMANGIVACFVNITSQWRAYALVSATQTNFRGRLLDVRSTLSLNADPSEAFQTIAADMATLAVNATQMDLDDWSLSVQVMREAASSASGAVGAPVLASLLGSADRLARVARASIALADSLYGANAQLRGSFSGLGLALLAASNMPRDTPVSYDGDFARVSAVAINGSQTGFEFNSNLTSGQRVSFNISRGVAPESAQLTFVLYSDDRLFSTGATVGSPVISASIASTDTSRLASPATFTVPFSGSNLQCVYFIEANNSWSSTGLRLVSRTATQAECSTWHLTNFAVLVDSTGASTTSGAAADALSIVGLVGCALSIAGLLVTLFCHLFFRSLRRSIPSKLLVQLCVALIVALSLFVLATQYRGSDAQCQALGLTMHYFWLAALCWMVAEAINLHAISVIVLNVNFALRLKLYALLGWVVPGLIVGITVAVAGIESYGGAAFCWINSSRVLIGAFLAPLAVAMLINSILFVVVFRALHRSLTQHRKRSSLSGQPENYKQNSREARAAVALVCLLGLGWLFGALVDPGDPSAGLVFQYLFAVCVALQGFGIFLFHCFYNEQVRSALSSFRDYRASRKQASGLSSSKGRAAPLRGMGLSATSTSTASTSASFAGAASVDHSAMYGEESAGMEHSRPLPTDPAALCESSIDVPGYLNVTEDLL